MYHDTEQWYNGSSVERAGQSGGAVSCRWGSKLDKELEMEVTLRDLEQAERDEARAEAVTAEAESAAEEYGKRMAALR